MECGATKKNCFLIKFAPFLVRLVDGKVDNLSNEKAKRNKIAGNADEIVGNFVRINYLYNACTRLCRCVWGGGISLY